MTFLAKEQNREEYLEQMTQLSKSAKIQTKYVLQRFDQFCRKEFDKTEAEVIQELRIVKKSSTEDEYKEALFKRIAQPFLNELSKVYDAQNVKVLFSYFKRYLVWSGIVIYREESKLYLRFPKKSQRRKARSQKRGNSSNLQCSVSKKTYAVPHIGKFYNENFRVGSTSQKRL